MHKHAYPFIYDITTRVPLRLLIYRHSPSEDDPCTRLCNIRASPLCTQRAYVIHKILITKNKTIIQKQRERELNFLPFGLEHIPGMHIDRIMHLTSRSECRFVLCYVTIFIYVSLATVWPLHEITRTRRVVSRPIASHLGDESIYWIAQRLGDGRYDVTRDILPLA